MNILSSINQPSDLKKYNTKELYLLADDIRNTIIDTVSKNGGHLASNLGVVELTLAIHSTFNSPQDKIIWDVGHQAYTHKLLTGRYEQFNTIRQYQGISGFPKITENEHDSFGAGHSSTSLSAALGMASARDIKGENHNVVAIIGDGSLTGGMAWEALNHIGHANKKLIIIINDNQMSISPNVGALSQHLNGLRTAPYYEEAKKSIVKTLNSIPVLGEGISATLEKIKNSLKYLMVRGIIFEELGLTYIGPIDGHDIKAMQVALNQAANASVPIVIHCLTKKGWGYQPATDSPDVYHGVSPFNRKTGQPLKPKNEVSFSKSFGKTLTELAHDNPKITAITAAMTSGVGLENFAQLFPDRFFDVGIAEQHAVTLAAGLAVAGLRPVVAVYSTFLQRAYDQILHDIALQNLPVIFAVDRAGLVGADGPTHHGVFDLSFMKSIPNITIMAPCNNEELDQMLRFALTLNSPVSIRYPRGSGEYFKKPNKSSEVTLGKAEVIIEGEDVVIWAIGRMVSVACQCAEILQNHNITATVVNSRFLHPLDQTLLMQYIPKVKLIVTLEDNVLNGGLGDSIAQTLSASTNHPPLKSFGIPHLFITHGSVNDLDEELGLNPSAICTQIVAELKK